MSESNALEINISTLRRNIDQISNYAKKTNPQVKYCLPVKANAYGHGLVEVAQALSSVVDCFGVSCADEGISIRNAKINNDILVFGAYENSDISKFIQYDLEFTISSLYKAQAVIDYCKKHHTKALIHIKIDTGMNRVGVRTDSALTLIDFVLNHSHYASLKGVYSHLACADSDDPIHQEFTLTQIEKFKVITQYVKSIDHNICCHLANSAGLKYSDAIFDMIRPGLISYGYNTNNIPGITVSSALSLKSKVVYFKVVDDLQGISYLHQYTPTQQTRIVTIPIGYGDGYRLSFSNKAPVIINDQLYNISGRICMDMCMVDIGSDGEAYVGDEVILIGQSEHHHIKIETLAEIADTHIYEILCSFNSRVSRKYSI